MSEAAIREYRAKMAALNPNRKPARTFPVDLGGCPKCGHLVLNVGGPHLFCPCEDCHSGGLVIRAEGVAKRAS